MYSKKLISLRKPCDNQPTNDCNTNYYHYSSEQMKQHRYRLWLYQKIQKYLESCAMSMFVMNVFGLTPHQNPTEMLAN